MAGSGARNVAGNIDESQLKAVIAEKEGLLGALDGQKKADLQKALKMAKMALESKDSSAMGNAKQSLEHFTKADAGKDAVNEYNDEDEGGEFTGYSEEGASTEKLLDIPTPSLSPNDKIPKPDNEALEPPPPEEAKEEEPPPEEEPAVEEEAPPEEEPPPPPPAEEPEEETPSAEEEKEEEPVEPPSAEAPAPPEPEPSPASEPEPAAPPPPESTQPPSSGGGEEQPSTVSEPNQEAPPAEEPGATSEIAPEAAPEANPQEEAAAEEVAEKSLEERVADPDDPCVPKGTYELHRNGSYSDYKIFARNMDKSVKEKTGDNTYLSWKKWSKKLAPYMSSVATLIEWIAAGTSRDLGMHVDAVKDRGKKLPARVMDGGPPSGGAKEGVYVYESDGSSCSLESSPNAPAASAVSEEGDEPATSVADAPVAGTDNEGDEKPAEVVAEQEQNASEEVKQEEAAEKEVKEEEEGFTLGRKEGWEMGWSNVFDTSVKPPKPMKGVKAYWVQPYKVVTNDGSPNPSPAQIFTPAAWDENAQKLKPLIKQMDSVLGQGEVYKGKYYIVPPQEGKPIAIGDRHRMVDMPAWYASGMKKPGTGSDERIKENIKEIKNEVDMNNLLAKKMRFKN